MLKEDFSAFYSLSSLKCLCPHQKQREHVAGCDLGVSWGFWALCGSAMAPVGVQRARPCQVPALWGVPGWAQSSELCSLPATALRTNPKTAGTVLGTGIVLSLLRTILLWLWAEGGRLRLEIWKGAQRS